MIQKSPVMRKCISCRTTFDRKSLLKITNDYKLGIMLNQGMGRSAYICKSKKCYEDSKLKKKLQKALKSVLSPDFFDIFEREIANYK
ncbi:YlxR family protein [Prochlorococcus sp. AH-716-O05]|nr:YlxR family protein [Prochlorococcus sp. AH-716-O05]